MRYKSMSRISLSISAIVIGLSASNVWATDKAVKQKSGTKPPQNSPYQTPDKQKKAAGASVKVKSSQLTAFQKQAAHYLWEQTVKPQNPIQIGAVNIQGLANLQASYWTHSHFNRRNNKAFLDLHSLYLRASSHLNQWTQVAISGDYKNGGSSAVKYWPTGGTRSSNRRPKLREATVTFANLSQSPLFVRLGQMYMPFGRYKRYSLVPSLTQQLTQMHHPGLQIGAIYNNGLYWSAYGVVDRDKTDTDHNLNNYGATLGYRSVHHPVNYDAGLSYLNNMTSIDSLYRAVDNNQGYGKRVPAVSVYGDLQMGPFGYGVRYVSALRDFDPSVYAYQDHSGSIEGARPDAFNIWASYKFKTLGHHSQLKLGYAFSDEALNVANNIASDEFYSIPKRRISASYSVNVIHDLVATVQMRRDRDYDHQHGGTNKHDYIGTVRLSYLF